MERLRSDVAEHPELQRTSSANGPKAEVSDPSFDSQQSASAAIAATKPLIDGHDLELWQRDRRIARFDGKPPKHLTRERNRSRSSRRSIARINREICTVYADHTVRLHPDVVPVQEAIIEKALRKADFPGLMANVERALARDDLPPDVTAALERLDVVCKVAATLLSSGARDQ
jgi:hypothetical protein